MRKITEQIANAFLQGNALKLSNSETDGTTLWLHGNPIAEKKPDGLFISACGWRTDTTKERLNALPNVQITQKAFQWYLNGEKWNGEMIKVKA